MTRVRCVCISLASRSSNYDEVGARESSPANSAVQHRWRRRSRWRHKLQTQRAALDGHRRQWQLPQLWSESGSASTLIWRSQVTQREHDRGEGKCVARAVRSGCIAQCNCATYWSLSDASNEIKTDITLDLLINCSCASMTWPRRVVHVLLRFCIPWLVCRMRMRKLQSRMYSPSCEAEDAWLCPVYLAKQRNVDCVRFSAEG